MCVLRVRAWKKPRVPCEGMRGLMPIYNLSEGEAADRLTMVLILRAENCGSVTRLVALGLSLFPA